MDYPEREPYFAHRFIRVLTKTAAAQTLGPQTCWLLSVVAMQEDSKRYRDAVTYYNEQLMPLVGCNSRNSLEKSRKKAVDAGWLHYEHGGKGKPGIYWVVIPDRFLDVQDGPCDEFDNPFFPSKYDGQTDGQMFFPSKYDGERDGERDGKVGGNVTEKCASSIPVPIPVPEPKNTRTHERARFVPPTLDAVRAYCLARKNRINPEQFVDHYESNGWKVGRNQMKDWQAAVRTWEKNGYHGHDKTISGGSEVNTGHGKPIKCKQCGRALCEIPGPVFLGNICSTCYESID